jgi:hypothetical protein
MIFAETFGWRRYAKSDYAKSDYAKSDYARSDYARPDLPASAPAPTVKNRFQLNGAQWTAEDDIQLRTFVAEGLPPRVIAARMQRTFHAVRARTTKLGLKNNRP